MGLLSGSFLRLGVTVALLSGLSPGSAQSQNSTGSFYQSPGAKKMGELLTRIYRETDWKTDPNKPTIRAEYYKGLLITKLSPKDQVLVEEALGNELLNAGDSEGAVHSIEMARKIIQEQSVAIPPEIDRRLHEELAISYLRLGEQENCLHYHGQKSCLFPLQASAVHKLPRGAEGALRELTVLLEKYPGDMESRWLLNVAYMQLGKYPAGVPRKWLIPSQLFDSEYNVGEFLEVAPAAGVAVTGHSGGVIMEDFDGDGLLDLMVSSSGPLDPLHLFHNSGDGTFSDRSREAGLTGEMGGLNLVVTDYNNDGHPDVLILRGGWWGKHGKYPMSLLRNNGNGTFDDVTEEAGLLSIHPTQTAAWADFDNDGFLDVYVGHESAKEDPHPSQLFHNNGNGTFTEVSAPNHLSEMGFVKGVAWGDLNNDGRPDLYVAVKYGRNHLFRNDGPIDPKNPRAEQWKFTDVTEKAGVAQQTETFATWFFDYDNDGWPDIYVSGYSVGSMQDVGAFEMGKPFNAELPRLYHNNHDGTFTDVSKAMHLDRAILVMGSSFGDLDNDGWLDVYLGDGEPNYQALLPNRMFRNNAGKNFQDVTTSGGFGHLQKGHGVAFGDIENDGYEDIFEKMGGAFPGDTYQSVLYRNPGNGNHWITLELEGVKTNRAAFGARIRVRLSGDASGKRDIYRTVGFGSSFGGNPLRQHIGIGRATRVEEVEVTWPASKQAQSFRSLEADHMYHLREGDKNLRMVSLKQALISSEPMSMPMDMQH
jgi:hypothetical protein